MVSPHYNTMVMVKNMVSPHYNALVMMKKMVIPHYNGEGEKDGYPTLQRW